jgi:hypothetical protein
MMSHDIAQVRSRHDFRCRNRLCDRDVISGSGELLCDRITPIGLNNTRGMEWEFVVGIFWGGELPFAPADL